MTLGKFNLTILTAIVLAVAGHSPRAEAVDISQMPVFVNPDVHPGNLVLVPSVEFPTVVSQANIQDEYSPDDEFIGYFDPNKCYVYNYYAQERWRHFSPTQFTDDRTCSGDDEWSGNFLNWAATQTIDPFRKVLTGGLRVVDTPTVTWLEKARHTGQGGAGYYPNRALHGEELIAGATPFDVDEFHVRIYGLGNRMRFELEEDDDLDNDNTPFDPDIHPHPDDPTWTSYDVAVRVAVCVDGLLESNCRRFSQGYKPLGLIQTNHENLRYSIFGYLNDSSDWRDGAALRARQKFVGPVIPGEGPNPNTEWDPETGVLIQNPNPEDAADTNDEFGLSINDSGVINYLNKFGQLNNNNLKSNDPVSELYYAAVRYIRGESNVDAYTSGATSQHADGFPVITDWDKDGHDPVLSACQVNVALGIGDIYTHDDKNLPGNTSTAGQEPSKPDAVANDDWIDVVSVTNRVGAMEGVGNIGSGGNFTGRDNSAYIAGLAYWANTTDMRPDDEGEVTMSTHWVDVLETQALEGMSRNQYALAAKFGGLKIPDDVDFDPMSDSIEEAWWHTNGETLDPTNGNPDFRRPDNFYTAGNANQMVDSLAEAFENILEEVGDVISAVSTTSQRLDTDTLVLQSGFSSDFWTGEIIALDPEDGDQEWRASDNFRTNSVRSSTYTADPTALNNPGRAFNTSLSGAPYDRLATTPLPEDMDVEELIEFVLGDRSEEDGEKVRNRGVHTLGDIINSGLVMSGPGNEGWARLGDPYGEGYATYLDGTKSDRGRWVFVGANDGMLHAFDSDDGSRAFSFVPFGVLQNLGLLAGPDYNDSHQFFVDGGITVRDAYIDGGWKTILVGSLGAGGKSVFALDVTNPGSFSQSNVLWEYNASVEEDEDLGYTFGVPEITRMEDGTGNGTWVAVFGNGYDSESGDAVLYVVNLQTGEEVDRIRFTDDVEDNGLSSPAVLLDSMTQTFLQRVYAGDLEGNVWRADHGDSGLESVDFNPLFTAGSDNGNGGNNGEDVDSRRSITTKPTLAATGQGGINVFFGTGRLLGDADRASTDIESFYSVRDADEQVSLDELSELTLVQEADGRRSVDNPGAGEKGWKLDLVVGNATDGERVLTRSSILFGQLFFTTFEPYGDVCSADGGINRLYVLNALSGAGALPGEDGASGSVDIGEGAPFPISPVIQPPGAPVVPPGDDTPPGDDDYEPPSFPEVDGPEEFCSTYGYPDPSTGQYVALGTICDGRQIWRQAR